MPNHDRLTTSPSTRGRNTTAGATRLLPKRALHLVCASALTAAAVMITPGVNTVAQAEPATQRVNFPLTCHVQAPSVVGTSTVVVDPVYATVTAPAAVVAGETAQAVIKMHPLSFSIGSLPPGARVVDASRIKVDIATSGAQDITPVVSGNTSVTGVKAFTVDAQGAPAANSSVVRLAGEGNETIGFSPNAATNSVAGASLAVEAAAMNLALPEVTIDFRPEPGAQNVTFGLNSAGSAGDYGSDANPLTLLVHGQAPVVGDVWVPVMCSARAGKNSAINATASSLITVPVVESKEAAAAAAAARPSTSGSADSKESRPEATPLISPSAAAPADGAAATAPAGAGQAAEQPAVAHASFTPSPWLMLFVGLVLGGVAVGAGAAIGFRARRKQSE